MRILITGALGFVGKHLSEYLFSKGSCEILGLDLKSEKNEKTKTISVDLRIKEKVSDAVKKFKPDQIFHLAAQSSVGYSWENPEETLAINVFGGLNILDAVRKNCKDCRLLVVCTAEEYGAAFRGDRAISEDSGISPSNPYAISKAALDFFAQIYQKSYSLNIFIARSFNHLGPGQSERFVISDFAKQVSEIEKGSREPIIHVGNINVFRDFLDIRDVIEAYYSIINKGETGEAYNVCSGIKSRIADLLEILISYSTCREIEIKLDKNKIRPFEILSIYGDNTKLKNHTGWTPRYDLRESLKNILSWWRERS